MVGFTLLSRSYYYLRRRSPGPPFPPDHRQAGERGATIHRYYILLHRASRWTILPRPSAPPCRSTSPESKETRFEHHATADLRLDLSLAYSVVPSAPPSRIPSCQPLALTLPPQLYRRASSTLTPQLSVLPHSSRRTSKTHPSRLRRRPRS